MRKHPFIIRVKYKIAFVGRFLSIIFVIASSPGALRFGGLFFIKLWIVPGVVKKELIVGVVLIVWTSMVTSGRFGPGFGENWDLNVSANIFAFSSGEYMGPFGPARG